MSEAKIWDFLGGPVVENSPTNAGEMCSIPALGTKIPHTEGQLSLCATTVEPMIHKPQLLGPHAAAMEALEPVLCSKRSNCHGKPGHCS